MSSISGSSGQIPNPNPIPEDHNRTDNVEEREENPEQQEQSAGVTETGLSVEVSSIGDVAPVTPLENQAVLVEGAVAGILDTGKAGSASALPPNPDAVAEAAEMLSEATARTQEPEDAKVEEDLDVVEEDIKNLSSLLMDAGSTFKEIKDRGQAAKSEESAVQQQGREGAAARLANLRRLHVQLKENTQNLSGKIQFLNAQLSNIRKSLSGKTREELESVFGERAEGILGTLDLLGLRYEGDGEWRIQGSGSIPMLSSQFNEFSARVANIQIPGEDSASEEDLSCCQTLISRVRGFFNTLVGLFNALYDRALYCFFWLITKIRNRLLPSHPADSDAEVSPNFVNPFASPTNQTQERSSSSSVRSAVSGRQDIGDDDAIRRPDPSSLEVANPTDQDEGDDGEEVTRL
ncbi:CT392 family protein [Chlamydia vaughanii]|uniref:CT392 family protein n=1 Tax=Chlamydia vaughanii TaxID=3112552 RepID=UPI0032B1DE49